MKSIFAVKSSLKISIQRTAKRECFAFSKETVGTVSFKGGIVNLLCSTLVKFPIGTHRTYDMRLIQAFFILNEVSQQAHVVFYLCPKRVPCFTVFSLF